MLFNSWEFALFFPVVTTLYFVLRGRARLWFLLLASCVFYMAFIPVYLLILLFTIAVDYYAGLWIDAAQGARRRRFLILSLVANIGVLAVFKYAGFLLDNTHGLLSLLEVQVPPIVVDLILPIGLSFHTFQAMSYTIEVYRGAQPAERDPLIYALYVMFYPQLVAGPIERPQNLLPQFHAEHTFDYDRVVSGLRRMLWGFFKKVFVADRLAVLVDAAFSAPTEASGLLLWVAAYAFTFQIYCDFSGYSDIAIGAARIMGFDLMKNFDRPYRARSIGEFWRRWHRSLSTWFRDYLYVPLGGSRRGSVLTARNLLIVFAVSGLWHGANWTFVVWGALHGLVLVVEQGVSRIIRPTSKGGARFNRAGFAKWFVTFHVVVIAWVFFRARSVGDALTIVGRMTDFLLEGGIRHLGVGDWSHALQSLGWFESLLALFGVLILLSGEWLNEKVRLEENFSNLPLGLRWATYGLAGAGLVYLGHFSQAQFIYFQF